VAAGRRALRSRRDIETLEALSWALYRAGRYSEAWKYSLQARRLGTRDAALYYRAGLLAMRLPGRKAEARRLLRRALAINPAWNLAEARQAREALKGLPA